MHFVTEENLIRLKVGLYGGLLFFSFFVIIAVPVTQNNLSLNGCFLYLDISGYGPDSNCNYPVAIAVIFQLLYGLFRLATLILLMLGKFNSEFILFTDMFQLIYTAVDAVALFLTFIGACILSAGINSACDLPNCEAIAAQLGDEDAVSRLHTAEAGAWISFIIWLVLVVVSVFWLFRQGKLPFFSRPAQTGDSTSGGTSPQMDTPPAADAPKY
ncbi:hypothetical protein BaRGS_00004629 [Batillaria attramentaria]|uniref:MARVEL domain-containing protein n=1 Tax=Batillaria attramentaria TaxID=370345 RepID=A0ABD0LXS3_9CAEN